MQQKIITYNHKKVVNIYIVYEITNFHDTHDYLTQTNALIGAVNLTKNADIDKYEYSRYRIGFDGHQFYTHPGGGTGTNAIIFGVDMNSSIKIGNKGKDILILGKGPTQGLGEHSLSAKKCHKNVNRFHKSKYKILFELVL